MKNFRFRFNIKLTPRGKFFFEMGFVFLYIIIGLLLKFNVFSFDKISFKLITVIRIIMGFIALLLFLDAMAYQYHRLKNPNNEADGFIISEKDTENP